MVRSLECCIPEKKDLSHEIGLENLKSFKSKKGTAIVAYRGSVRPGRSPKDSLDHGLVAYKKW